MTTGRLTSSRFITILNSLQMMSPSSCTWGWLPAHTLDEGSCPEFWGQDFRLIWMVACWRAGARSRASWRLVILPVVPSPSFAGKTPVFKANQDQHELTGLKCVRLRTPSSLNKY